MKLTIVYDNETTRDDLIPAWGFSCLIETDRKILFDTGWDGSILLSNMRALGCGPGDIDAIVLSHLHWDHVCGLSSLLCEAGDAEVIVPASFSKHLRQEMGKDHSVRIVGGPDEIFRGIYSTGELKGSFQGMTLGEQSLAVETSKGLLVVAGCSHPGVEKILEMSRQFGELYGIVGGLHGFDEYGILKGLKLIVPTHCTKHKKEINEKYKDQSEVAGVGWSKVF